MTWIKLDDNAVDHPKVASLTDRAFRWWVRGLSYASRLLTNGVLPPTFWKQAPYPVRNELTTGKLWDWHDPNFHIHDYLKHQTSREVVAKKKADTADRVARHREAKRNAVTCNTSNAPVTASENREQNQRTETETEKEQKQGSAPSARPAPLIAPGENVRWFKRHGAHVVGFCDWVCLDEQQVSEFAAKIPGDDHALKVKQIRDWALSIRAQWADRIVGDGSHFDFWRNRWTETHGGSRPANATLKAAKAAADLDEAFR